MTDDEIDALRTERNNAVREAALWQRRMYVMQRQRDRAVGDANQLKWLHVEYEALQQELKKLRKELYYATEDANYWKGESKWTMEHLTTVVQAWLKS